MPYLLWMGGLFCGCQAHLKKLAIALFTHAHAVYVGFIWYPVVVLDNDYL